MSPRELSQRLPDPLQTAVLEPSRVIYLKLAWYFRLQWRRYAIAIAALIAIAGLVMVPPWLTGRLVDAVAERSLTSAQLFGYVGAIAAAAVFLYIFRYLWRVFLYSSSYQLASLLRQRIYQHLTGMAPAFFQRHGTGDLMARATNDINAVEMTAGEGVLSMVDGALMGTVVLAVLLFAFSWKLTLLALLPWPVMAYLMWRFGNELHRAFRDAQAQFSALNDRVQESIATIRLIKAFGQEARETGAFAQAVDRAGHANLEVARIDAKYDPTIFLTIGSSFLLTVGGGAWLIHHGEMTLGELTSFTMYLSYLIWPMFAFGWLLNIVERGSAAYARIEQLLNTKPDIDDAGHLTALPAPPRIEFMVHRFAYPGARHEVLRDVQAVVPAGATLGIVGPTGAGKTTLLNLLLRLVEAPTTEVRIAGHSVRDYRLETLRAAIALVPQDPFLFSATVAENIALGRPEATLEEIRAAARSACIDDEIMAFPDQYDTLVGERGMTLSGGQKQRIAIARALLLDAPILVLDDVLSAVDVKTETRILQHLRALRRGRTTLIVSHRLSAVAEADHIIVLRHGRIVEQGSHDELLAADGWYAQMFRYQQIERAVAEGR